MIYCICCSIKIENERYIFICDICNDKIVRCSSLIGSQLWRTTNPNLNHIYLFGYRDEHWLIYTTIGWLCVDSNTDDMITDYGFEFNALNYTEEYTEKLRNVCKIFNLSIIVANTFEEISKMLFDFSQTIQVHSTLIKIQRCFYKKKIIKFYRWKKLIHSVHIDILYHPPRKNGIGGYLYHKLCLDFYKNANNLLIEIK